MLVVFVVVEAITVNLVSVWFAIGAAAAGAAAYLEQSVTVQIVIFLAVSAVSIAVFKKLFGEKIAIKHVPTNADRLIGKTATVTEDIDPVKGTGVVDVEGNVWSAKADYRIPAGAVVDITEIIGVKLVVKERMGVR